MINIGVDEKSESSYSFQKVILYIKFSIKNSENIARFKFELKPSF